MIRFEFRVYVFRFSLKIYLILKNNLLNMIKLRVPLSSEYGTYKRVKARFWPSRAGNGP